MTPMSNPSNLMNIDSSNLLANHITTNEEESQKTSDTVLSLLRQMSMKITLISQDQNKILLNQANLFVEVKDLRTKLEQQANKPVIPLPPPPPLNTSLAIGEKTKNFSNHNNSVNELKNIDNKQTMQEELQEELQKKLNKIRDKSEQNNYDINSKPKENGISALEPELNFKLRRTQSLYIKPENNTKAPENMGEKKIVSVADRIKQLQEIPLKNNV